jgi:transcriptional regulator with XRE-family HTH domain
MGNMNRHNGGMAESLQKQLGRFLRKRRGSKSLHAFARKLGISHSSLHRMEMGEQNVTLKTLELLLKRLKCGLSEVFHDGQL